MSPEINTSRGVDRGEKTRQSGHCLSFFHKNLIPSPPLILLKSYHRFPDASRLRAALPKVTGRGIIVSPMHQGPGRIPAPHEAPCDIIG